MSEYGELIEQLTGQFPEKTPEEIIKLADESMQHAVDSEMDRQKDAEWFQIEL